MGPIITNAHSRVPQPLLTVLVGSGTKVQRFEIHESVGIQSPFLKKAFVSLSNKLGNLDSSTLSLPDVDASAFGLLVNWLYTKNIEVVGGRQLDLLETARLWTVAALCHVPILQSRALVLVETALATMKRQEVIGPSTQTFKEFCHHAYETSDSTPLKRLAMDQITRLVAVDTIDLWLRTLPRDMINDLTKALVKKLELLLEDMVEGRSELEASPPASASPTMKKDSF